MPWRTRLRVLLSRYLPFVLERLDLSEDLASNGEIIESVRQGVELRGANLWILILATLIASVGLNVNSTAVIIGAMLVSPVMGPIIGIGTGIALLDSRMVRFALKNLGFAVVFAVMASTLYFVLSPLSGAQSELLARTSPSIWDVLIALAGGIAGMIGNTRRTKSNVIPGVAIATALLPPLCTAGFGISRLDLAIFSGAFFLFFINAVFICVGTYIVCRLVGLHDDAKSPVSYWFRRGLILMALVALLPSLWIASRLVGSEHFEKRVGSLLSGEFSSSDGTILERKSRVVDGKKQIDVVVLGTADPEALQERLNGAASRYGLRDIRVVVVDALNGVQADRLRSGSSRLLESLYLKNEETLKSKTDEIARLQALLDASRGMQLPFREIEQEARALYPELAGLRMAFALGGSEGDRPLFARLTASRVLGRVQKTTLRDWLKARTGATEVFLIEQVSGAKTF